MDLSLIKTVEKGETAKEIIFFIYIREQEKRAQGSFSSCC